jgi:hypothetical protein
MLGTRCWRARTCAFDAHSRDVKDPMFGHGSQSTPRGWRCPSRTLVWRAHRPDVHRRRDDRDMRRRHAQGVSTSGWHSKAAASAGTGRAGRSKVSVETRLSDEKDPLSKIRHDLRTPINQTVGYASCSRRRARLLAGRWSPTQKSPAPPAGCRPDRRVPGARRPVGARGAAAPAPAAALPAAAAATPELDPPALADGGAPTGGVRAADTRAPGGQRRTGCWWSTTTG